MWTKRKIIDKGFVEDVDYISMHKTVRRDNGGNKSKEYMLTIDTAKNVCMMENTDAGGNDELMNIISKLYQK